MKVLSSGDGDTACQMWDCTVIAISGCFDAYDISELQGVTVFAPCLRMYAVLGDHLNNVALNATSFEVIGFISSS